MTYEPNQAGLKLLLREYAEGARRTVFLLGAGVSKEVGLPLWRELSAGLFQFLNEATPGHTLQGPLLQSYHSVEEAFEQQDYWRMFNIVETNWPTIYEDFVAQEFSAERLQAIEVPRVYERIWRLKKVRQVLTLNIDGLCKRAFDSVFRGRDIGLLEYVGRHIVDCEPYFSRDHHVLLHLHGVHYSKSSWVMSAKGREELFDGVKGAGYRAFLRNLFQNYNVVFLGVNPRDVAISPVLEEIATIGWPSATFWIAPNISTEDFTWAQKNKVRVVNYAPSIDKDGIARHSAVICEILDDLEAAVSHDLPVRLPAVGEGLSLSQIPKPEQLASRVVSERSEVRQILSGGIDYLLNDLELEFNSSQIEAYLKKYDLVIQSASIFGKMEGYNTLGEYTLVDEISSSPTTSVWLARRALASDEGSYYIAKVLTPSAFRDIIERESFRRGIESLYLLNSQNLPVAPRYEAYFHVPMCVIMEHVSGTSIDQLMPQGGSHTSSIALSVFANVCRAVLACHRSEGRVLHRDLKPKNILLKDVYDGADNAEIERARVILINFDLSWHKFSRGNTKAVPANEAGFYAPEQRAFANSDTPRTAATDVYMLGMLLYQLVSNVAPPEGGSRVSDWRDLVFRAYRNRCSSGLVANRLARLTLRMTAQIPEERGDLSGALADLDSILIADKGSWSEVDADILVERLLYESGFDYVWVDKSRSGRVASVRPIDLTLAYVERGQRVELKFSRSRGDATERKGFGGRLAVVMSEVVADLQRRGWESVAGGGVIKSIAISCHIKALRTRSDLGIEEVKGAIRKLMANID